MVINHGDLKRDDLPEEVDVYSNPYFACTLMIITGVYWGEPITLYGICTFQGVNR
jgi:hypothetical protein